MSCLLIGAVARDGFGAGCPAGETPTPLVSCKHGLIEMHTDGEGAKEFRQDERDLQDL